MPEQVSYRDDLTPPVPPYAPVQMGESGLSSRRSSFSSMDKGGVPMKNRPSSLSINYVPAKFSKLHEPGQWAHRRAKQGGGRDAFAQNAQRMGDMGTVDDDEGIVFQLGKGGLRSKTKPKLRWNRFKWFLFLANTVVSVSPLRKRPPVALIRADGVCLLAHFLRSRDARFRHLGSVERLLRIGCDQGRKPDRVDQ